MVGSQVFSYEQPSTLDVSAQRLDLSTSGGRSLLGPLAHPRFFSGFLVRPDVTAAGLRAVAQVAAANFGLTVRRRSPCDPLVTSHGDRLRFESFSSCGGVLARLDLLSEGFDGQVSDRGTTNVDVNEPLRRMLARVGPRDVVHLAVGRDELVVTTPDVTHVERKVQLPTRWVRGFAEAQHIASQFAPRLELDAVAATRFLTSMRRGASGWVVQAGRSWRLASQPGPGAVHLGGVQRLEALTPLLRLGSSLRAYGPDVRPNDAEAPSAWELTLPGARLVVMLSPHPRRGFSGEGAALEQLSQDAAIDDADTLHSILAFDPALDPLRLATDTGLDLGRIHAALTCLATAGRVGWDLAEASYFHRELPYDPSSVETLNPRLAHARRLVADDRVRLIDDGLTEVIGTTATYRVRARPDGSVSCTCRWWTTHQGSRGPCKHVLATTLTRAAAPDTSSGEDEA